MHRERNFLIARGHFSPIFEDYLEHSRKWVGNPDGLILTMMKQALAAAGLYLTFRTLDENTAWTINFAEPPINIFVTSDASTGKVVGRYFEENVKTVDHNRIFVQAIRNIGKPQMSAVRVKGFDILGIFGQYYEQSEQLPARFFEFGNDEYMMLNALPDIDEPWLMSISGQESMKLLRSAEVRMIEERTVTFGCMCDREKVFGVVHSMFAGKQAELFGEDAEVQVRCPRCGRSYCMTREDFERQEKSRGT